jgi:hypothetical protein
MFWLKGQIKYTQEKGVEWSEEDSKSAHAQSNIQERRTERNALNFTGGQGDPFTVRTVYNSDKCS